MGIRKKRGFNRSFLGFCGFLAILAAWLRDAGTVSAAVGEGLSLCVQAMIPSLFPFLVLSNLFIRRNYQQFAAAALRPLMKPLFGLPAEAGGALVLGAVSGYPVGADMAFRLYDAGRLNERETSRLLAFCNNAGPGFVFGVVGLGLFGSAGIGLRLYLIHLSAALLVGILLHFVSDPPVRGEREPLCLSDSGEPFVESFVASVREAAVTMTGVCAFLVFFAVLLAFLRTTPFLALPARFLGTALPEPAARALPEGFLELSHGIAALRKAGCCGGGALSVSAFLLGWGGLCVHAQTFSLRKGRKIEMGLYCKGKLAQGLLSALMVRSAISGLLLCAAGLILTLLFGKFRRTSGKLDGDAV